MHLEARGQVEEASHLIDIVHLALEAGILNQPLEAHCAHKSEGGREGGGARRDGRIEARGTEG